MLRALHAHGVRFVVVGGFAAWMQDAPVVTTDLDIVYDTSPENLDALTRALRALAARYRHQLGRVIEPDPAKLGSTEGGGHHLFETRFGDLDALRSSSRFGYSELVTTAVTYEIEGVPCLIASLADVIEMKRLANRPKDVAALPALMAVLEDASSEDSE
ncbi:MAG: nucleotidyl transferase AbiEii/AbiGii toxin family protein [Deltaproteobacteria bacterium]|nr:nucleotidyl transferase AbiEii/AbiGii toxin family protein [Deltaproteobacteria bacterium]